MPCIYALTFDYNSKHPPSAYFNTLVPAISHSLLNIEQQQNDDAIPVLSPPVVMFTEVNSTVQINILLDLPPPDGVLLHKQIL